MNVALFHMFMTFMTFSPTSKVLNSAGESAATAFGNSRARQQEKPLIQVHHIHQTFAFIEMSGEHCIFRFFTTFTLFTTFTKFTFQRLTSTGRRSRHNFSCQRTNPIAVWTVGHAVPSKSACIALIPDFLIACQAKQ